MYQYPYFNPLLLAWHCIVLKENSMDLTLLVWKRWCTHKIMLTMYLKYHKAGLTPTTPVTSTSISPVKMLIGRKSLTNLHSEMIFLQGKPVFWYLPTIYTPTLTDNPPILLTQDSSWAAKGKVGHVRHISAFRSFSGFIIYNY